MTPESIDRAARILLDARRQRYQIDELPSDCRPETLEEAGAIADRLIELWGTDTVGWLLGLTNPYMQNIFSVTEPYARPILAGNLHSSPARFGPATLLTRGLECEVAFRLQRDLPPRQESYTDREVAAAVAGMLPAVEIVNSHFKDWLNLPLPMVIADNGTDGPLVLGEEVAAWAAIDRVALPVTLTVDGERVEEGRGANAMGDPLGALVWLANKLSSQGQGLKAGEVINTGTCVPLHGVPEGCEAVAEFGPLGQVHITF